MLITIKKRKQIMLAIRKEKLIAIFCILVFGFTGLAMAQEKITDASLTGLISEGNKSSGTTRKRRSKPA
jgi:hypothetical protein